MAQISRSTKVNGGTTLASNTLARAADVETDMLTLFNAHNNADTGTTKWTVVSVEGSSSVPLVVSNSSGTQNIANFQDNGSNVLTVADGGTTTVTATNGGSSKALVVNNGTSTGNILEAQDNGTAVMTVADGGNVTFTGKLLAPDGTNSLPAYSFASASSNDNGMYLSTTDTVGITAGGTLGLTVAATAVTSVVKLVAKGTATNDSAASGNIGEYIESLITSATSFPSSGQWGDGTSITLTAGDWDVTFTVLVEANGATVTSWGFGISTTTGNSSSGLVEGTTRGTSFVPTASIDSYGTMPNVRMSIAGSTIVYGKLLGSFSVATMRYKGCRLSARRVR